jgi:hypothetical protein
MDKKNNMLSNKTKIKTISSITNQLIVTFHLFSIYLDSQHACKTTLQIRYTNIPTIQHQVIDINLSVCLEKQELFSEQGRPLLNQCQYKKYPPTFDC